MENGNIERDIEITQRYIDANLELLALAHITSGAGSSNVTHYESEVKKYREILEGLKAQLPPPRLYKIRFRSISDLQAVYYVENRVLLPDEWVQHETFKITAEDETHLVVMMTGVIYGEARAISKRTFKKFFERIAD